jgi:lactobin A/cerein 7B family class IIb bacteriocin
VITGDTESEEIDMFQSTTTDRTAESELNDAQLDQASGGILPFIVAGVAAAALGAYVYNEVRELTRGK